MYWAQNVNSAEAENCCSRPSLSTSLKPGLPDGSDGKESTCGRPGLDPWVGKIPWSRARQPTPVFLPGECPWTEVPGGLYSTGLQRVGHDWVTKHTSYVSHPVMFRLVPQCFTYGTHPSVLFLLLVISVASVSLTVGCLRAKTGFLLQSSVSNTWYSAWDIAGAQWIFVEWVNEQIENLTLGTGS